MVPEANQALEVMKIKEVLNRQEIQVRENFHNKEGIPKEVKEIQEEMVTETEEVK